jgi:hypothetical protein
MASFPNPNGCHPRSVDLRWRRKERIHARQTLCVLWQEGQRLGLVMVGSVLSALGFALFQVPYDSAAGGVNGIGIIT